MAEPRLEVEERLTRIEEAITTMALWLVQAQTGFGVKDAAGIEKILYGERKDNPMTWTINIGGHDDLGGEEKSSYEKAIVEKARALVEELKAAEGGVISHASAVTNTTGSVDLLAE